MSCFFPATRMDYYVAFGIFFIMSFEEEEALFYQPLFFIFQVKTCCLDYLCFVHATVVKKEWQIRCAAQFCNKPDTAFFPHLSPFHSFSGGLYVLNSLHSLAFKT